MFSQVGKDVSPEEGFPSPQPPGVIDARQRLASRLQIIIVAFLAIMLALIFIYMIVDIEQRMINVGIASGSALFFASLLLLLRRDRVRLTAGLFVGYLYVTTTIVALSFDGIHDTSLVVYFLLIAISGLLLGARAAFVASILSALALGLVYGLDLARGAITPPQQPAFLKVIEMGALLLVMGVVLRLTIHDLRDALERARDENVERRIAQAALARAHDELEERVAERTAELARANRDLNTLIQASRDGILFVTHDRRLAVINERAIELLQLPGDVMHWRGRPTEELLEELARIIPEAADDVRSQLARLRAAKVDAPYEGEFGIGGRYLNWTAVPVALDTDAGELVVLHDVSAEREAEQVRRDLVHAMVHDLRNPLSTMLSILGLLKLLDQTQKEPLSDRQRQNIFRLTQSVDHMTRLVNNILDVSRLESGQMPLRRVPFHVADLVTETVEAQRPLASSKALALQSDVAPDLPAIMADRAMMARVLQNLLDNAIKFTPSGGHVRVAAESTHAPDHSRAVQLTVRDTGPGIPPEVAPRLFQKFAAGEHDGSGSGLGLAFCRLTVEAHGGRLWLDDAGNGGAAFTFTVPAANGGRKMNVTSSGRNP